MESDFRLDVLFPRLVQNSCNYLIGLNFATRLTKIRLKTTRGLFPGAKIILLCILYTVVVLSL